MQNRINKVIDIINSQFKIKIKEIKKYHNEKINKHLKIKNKNSDLPNDFYDKLQKLRSNSVESIQNTVFDFSHLLKYVKSIKLEEAGIKEKPLLQYGMFYDGLNTLYYDSEVVNQLNDIDLTKALLNHLFHSYSKAHLKLGDKPTKNTLIRYGSHAGLYLSHFGFSSIKPKYTQSIRDDLYYMYEEANEIVFTPHVNTSNYFYNKIVEQNIDGEVKNADGLKMKINTFKTTIGAIVEIEFLYGFVTKSRGFLEVRRDLVRKSLINKDGEWLLTSPANKIAREVREMKKIADILS